MLEAEGISTRLVSMPCMENFAAQDAEYRESVLPAACHARVSVEAAATLGWREWVGEVGEMIGMETFGASAPAGALYKHFGFTPERVADVGREVVTRARSGAVRGSSG
jgi:transketolase